MTPKDKAIKKIKNIIATTIVDRSNDHGYLVPPTATELLLRKEINWIAEAVINALPVEWVDSENLDCGYVVYNGNGQTNTFFAPNIYAGKEVVTLYNKRSFFPKHKKRSLYSNIDYTVRDQDGGSEIHLLDPPKSYEEILICHKPNHKTVINVENIKERECLLPGANTTD